MLTLKAVNREIHKFYPQVDLFKGDGYFYLWPRAGFTGLDWAKTTSIMVNRINDMGIDGWMEDVHAIMENS